MVDRWAAFGLERIELSAGIARLVNKEIEGLVGPIQASSIFVNSGTVDRQGREKGT